MNLRFVTYALALLIWILPNQFAMANTSRYPSGNLAYCGDVMGIVRGEHDGWLPLSLQIAIDPTFNDDQKEILFEALKIFIERGSMNSVLDCAFRNSWRDMPVSREALRKELFSAITKLQIGDITLPSFAFISRYWDDPTSVGLGFIGLFFDRDKPMPGLPNRHYLHVGINSDYLGNGSSYFYRHDVEYWAGVIGHEFLHNLGYVHPNGYRGSFVSEYGHCIRRSGADGAPLEGELQDLQIEKNM